MYEERIDELKEMSGIDVEELYYDNKYLKEKVRFLEEENEEPSGQKR